MRGIEGKSARREEMKKSFFIFLTIFFVCGSALYAGDKPKQETTVRKIDVKVGSDTSTQAQGEAADPYEEMAAMRTRMEKFFEEAVPQAMRRSPQDYLFPNRPFQPAANVEDHADKLLITLDVPGVNKEDIKVTLKGNLLTVSGERKVQSEERKDEKGRKVFSQERFTGSFQRTFRLPAPVKEDTMKAKYENGVLTVEAMKETPTPAAEAKTIPVE